MPDFNFNFKVVKKPFEKKVKSTHNDSHKRLSLVVDTTEEGLFFVTNNNVDYEISLNSYNCAYTHEVYITKLDKGKIIRYSNPSRYIGNCRPYIRFIPGNTVRGYIIKNPNTLKEEFYIENVLIDIPLKMEITKKFYNNFKKIVKRLNVKLEVLRQNQFS